MVKDVRYLSLSKPLALPDISMGSARDGHVTFSLDLTIESLVGREDSGVDLEIKQAFL